jgi:hypothetical protein
MTIEINPTSSFHIRTIDLTNQVVDLKTASFLSNKNSLGDLEIHNLRMNE